MNVVVQWHISLSYTVVTCVYRCVRGVCVSPKQNAIHWTTSIPLYRKLVMLEMKWNGAKKPEKRKTMDGRRRKKVCGIYKQQVALNSLNGEWKKAKYVLRDEIFVKEETKRHRKCGSAREREKERKRKGGEIIVRQARENDERSCVCLCVFAAASKMGERCKRESTTRNSWFC